MVETSWALPPTWCNPVAPCDGSILVRKGLCLGWVVRSRPLSTHMLLVSLGAFGTLGVGAGFALGAKLCRPDAEVSQGAGGRRLAVSWVVRYSSSLVPCSGVVPVWRWSLWL